MSGMLETSTGAALARPVALTELVVVTAPVSADAGIVCDVAPEGALVATGADVSPAVGTGRETAEAAELDVESRATPERSMTGGSRAALRLAAVATEVTFESAA
jgi:hypothetical protein